jgi:hypothetical protein
MVLDPVNQLEMRAEFISRVIELVILCNWPEQKIKELQELLLEELAFIDNLMYEVFEETGRHDIAYATWEAYMEDLRRWLSLMIGIKIKFV